MKLYKQSRLARTLGAALAAVLLISNTAALAAEPPGGEKRFLVRYEHGSANLAPWAGLALYVSVERIRVVAGNEVMHEIRPQDVTSFTHELRSPFDPARVTERVLNDTIGSCSDLLTCAVFGAGGVVGAAGVGVATLFTPKEFVITLNWTENNQPQTLAMKIAWYQKLFILGALEKSTGRKAAERLRGSRAPGIVMPAPAAQPGGAQNRRAAEGQPAAPPADQTPQAVPAVTRASDSATRAQIRRFELLLDRPALVGETLLPAGFYLVLVQDRNAGEAVVAFVPDSDRTTQTFQIAVRALVRVEPGPEEAGIQPVFSQGADAAELAGIHLPGRLLKFSRTN